jgi:hypothetical protein
MKAIELSKLANVVGGQAANLLAQGQATVNYNNCMGAAQNKANTATGAIFGQMKAGTLSPTEGVAQGVGVNRTLRSDVAACDAQNPIPQ